VTVSELTLNLLTTTIVAPPNSASKWQMGFNSAFKGLNRNKHLIPLPNDVQPGTAHFMYSFITKQTTVFAGIMYKI